MPNRDNMAKADLLSYASRDDLTALANLEYDQGVRLLMKILDARLEKLMLGIVAEGGKDIVNETLVATRLARFHTLAWVRDIPEAARAIIHEAKEK